MFITESPVIGSYVKKQGAFNIPLYKTQIKDNTYNHLTKKSVNYGATTQLPDIQKIKNTPFDIFTDAPKKSSAQKWRQEEIKQEKILDTREKRLENVLGKDIQLLMNPVILDKSPGNDTVFDDIITSSKGITLYNVKTGKQILKGSRTTSEEVPRPVMMDIDAKTFAGEKRKTTDNPLKLSKKLKADKSVAGNKRTQKVQGRFNQKRPKTVKTDKFGFEKQKPPAQKRKAPNQIKLSEKRRKLEPLTSTSSKRKGSALENPKKKVQKTKDPKETRQAGGKTLRRKKRVNYKE